MTNKPFLLPALALLLVIDNSLAGQQGSGADADTRTTKSVKSSDSQTESKKTADTKNVGGGNGSATTAEDSEMVNLDTVTISTTADDDDGEKLYNAKYSSSATRTDTPIKEIPQSIQVITRKLINDQQNVTVSETLRNVSGVMPNNVLFTPSADATKIRGFAAEQLLDGFTQYYNPGDRESTVNLERVEVLKGSNAVLYSGGSGAPVGGVVNLVSKLPKATAAGQLDMKYGSYDFYQPSIDINQPFSDKVMFRFTGELTDAGSFLDNIHTERFNVNPVITFTNNNDTTLTIQGRVAQWKQKEYQGLPATGTVAGDFKIRENMFIGSKDIEPSYSDFSGVWGTLDHWFNDTWSVNLKARYAESEFDSIAQNIFGRDITDSNPNAFNFTADLPFHIKQRRWGLANTELFQEQQEMSFLGNALAQFNLGPTQNKILFGGDYSEFDDSGFIKFDTTSGTGDAYAFVNLRWKNPRYPEWARSWEQTNDLFVKNTTYGGYAQLQSTWYDRLHLLFSARAGVVEIDYSRRDFRKYDGLTSETRIMPRAGAVFDLTKQFSLFVNYSEGMRGQPFTQFSGKPKPALSDSLEAGIKVDIADQLSGQLAFYQIDRSNVAVSGNNDPFSSIPGGTQRSQGFDTDWVWHVTPSLHLLGNYAYTDAKFTNDLRGPDDAQTPVSEGTLLFGVPEHSTRFWANYDFPQPLLKGLSLGAGVYWQSETFLSNRYQALNDFKADSYHTFDASASYQFQRYKLAVTVKNLTDESYFQSYGYLGGRVAPAQGVSAYATFTVNY
jgi:iron complex outermembrane receptor protein